MQRYHLKTFGCQMNVHDSERIEEVLEKAGYVPTERPEDADLVVINTCSVREKAEQKARSLVGTLTECKRQRPGVVVAVVGCVAQEHGKALLSRMKAVDLVVGPDNLADLPALARAAQAGAAPSVRTVFDLAAPVFLRADPRSGRGAPASTYVTVMKGCDERCSFCIVPSTRGPERYRPSGEIIDEIRRWSDAGVREVTLLGQTVNSYRDPTRALGPAPDAAIDDPDESELAALLWEIARQVKGLLRLRYTSPHPRHVTSSLVRAHREIEILARHVHLPVQSGSDAVLRRMIRRYTRREYVDRARDLVAARDGLVLSTDVIVGFPGETDEDFRETLSLVREVRFVSVFGFQYSPRPNTPSTKLEDDVPESVKRSRLAELFALGDGLVAAHLVSLVGTEQRVLFEGPDEQGTGRLTGRTERNEIVHLDAAGRSDFVGEIVPVLIRRAFKHSLEGELGAAVASRPKSRDYRRLPLVPVDE
jgi:tRNA-2-methylthio-N6-dimethylallyladenosine synthase